MALIVGGTVAVTTISSSLAGTIFLVNKINADYAERMADISNQHIQAMEVLNNKQNSENNRHKEFMGMLDKLFEALKILGNSITNAEYKEHKGLPGKKPHAA